MIIATRILTFQNQDIAVNLYAPERGPCDWLCRFDIHWPSGVVERFGTGVDAVQAIIQALQMIGAEIYTSSYFESGGLSWLAGYVGCGFPVPNNVREILPLDDAKYM